MYHIVRYGGILSHVALYPLYCILIVFISANLSGRGRATLIQNDY